MRGCPTPARSVAFRSVLPRISWRAGGRHFQDKPWTEDVECTGPSRLGPGACQDLSPFDISSLHCCNPEAICHRLHAGERTVDPGALETPAPASTICGSVKLPAAQGARLSVPPQTLMLPSVPGKPQVGYSPLSNAGYKQLTGQRAPRSLQH